MAKQTTKKPAKKAAKPAPKKAVKKTVKKSTTKSATSATNKELDKMIAKVNKAKESGEKSVVVYTTSKSSHKAKRESSMGFGVSDLKPKLYEAYKHMLLNYDVRTRPVDLSEMKVEWYVNIK